MVAQGGSIAPEGKPKSGRVWKTKQSSRHTAKNRQGVLAHMSKTYEERQATKAQKQYVKDLEKQMKDEKATKIAEQKQQRVEREQRRIANEYKSSVYQVIKPEKMKTMSKKQLRMIKKTAVNKHGQVELVNPWASQNQKTQKK